MPELYLTIETKHGLLKGQKRTSSAFPETTYYSFQGVPFAKPPVENLRFRDPQEVEPWSGIRDALTEGNHSCQYDNQKKKCLGDEDCLYMNVYTRKPSARGKAVMVWIHGGAFTMGSASSEVYGPEYLIEHDIVLVTTNYRLGALGFLCLGNDDVPGNAALKDQVMALKWVQKNISSFGGDPNNVTLFGESAGAICVHYHVLSPLSKGLFHRAIIQSGSVLNPWSYMDQTSSVARAFKLGNILGCKTENADELLEFLQKLPAYKITEARVQLESQTDSDKWVSFQKNFVPCIELPRREESFLSLPPKEIIEKGLFTKVPIIMGITNREGGIILEVAMHQDLDFEKVNNQFEALLSPDVCLAADREKSIQHSNEVKTFYFGDEQPSWETFDELVILLGDVFFQNGFDKALHLHLEASDIPIYTYYLQYEPSFSIVKTLLKRKFPNVHFKGAAHGDDLGLLFNQPAFKSEPSPEDTSVSQKLTKAWTHFAKTGNPSYEGIDTVWIPSKRANLYYLDIGKGLELVRGRISSDRMKFWQTLKNN